MLRSLLFLTLVGATALFATTTASTNPAPIAPPPCLDTLGSSPALIFDVSGGTLLGPVHTHMTVYLSGYVTIARKSEVIFQGTEYVDVQTATVSHQELIDLLRDLYFADIYTLWLVSKSDTHPDLSQLDREVLSRAVRRIHGDGSQPGWTLYGLPAWDFLIDRFRQVPFCGNCGPESCGHAAIAPIYSGALQVIAYLRELPFDASGVAGHYESIAEELEPYISNKGSNIDTVMGSLDRQNDFADTLDVCRRRCLEAAVEIDALESTG